VLECAAATHAKPHRPSKKLLSLTFASTTGSLLWVAPMVFKLLGSDVGSSVPDDRLLQKCMRMLRAIVAVKG
jgi:hypothetical protein